jgi:hypothetical protein
MLFFLFFLVIIYKINEHCLGVGWRVGVGVGEGMTKAKDRD